MSNFKDIDITICDNGFMVTTPETNESFVFSTFKKLKKWIGENIAPTGKVRDFCDGLDNGSKKKSDWDANSFLNIASQQIQEDIDSQFLHTELEFTDKKINELKKEMPYV